MDSSAKDVVFLVASATPRGQMSTLDASKHVLPPNYRLLCKGSNQTHVVSRIPLVTSMTS